MSLTALNVTRKNPSRTAKAPLQPHYSGAPFEKIAIDILEVPMSDQGNRFIVIGDYFSKELRLPLDVQYQLPDGSTAKHASEYVTRTKERFLQAYEVVRENLGLSQKTMKDHYDRKAFGEAFDVGDKVWYYDPRVKKGRSPGISDYQQQRGKIDEDVSNEDEDETNNSLREKQVEDLSEEERKTPLQTMGIQQTKQHQSLKKLIWMIQKRQPELLCDVHQGIGKNQNTLKTLCLAMDLINLRAVICYDN
ncbi:unnamed protein product [Mytilus edulis]|uniref:Uncharacterized protein n=1 Tax=Mytilus edulis TaxID=6550 RepID=A0A8S3PY70_MYTED|nr:unnamed protein product [Mytilus edulis]